MSPPEAREVVPYQFPKPGIARFESASELVHLADGGAPSTSADLNTRNMVSRGRDCAVPKSGTVVPKNGTPASPTTAKAALPAEVSNIANCSPDGAATRVGPAHAETKVAPALQSGPLLQSRLRRSAIWPMAARRSIQQT